MDIHTHIWQSNLKFTNFFKLLQPTMSAHEATEIKLTSIVWWRKIWQKFFLKYLAVCQNLVFELVAKTWPLNPMRPEVTSIQYRSNITVLKWLKIFEIMCLFWLKYGSKRSLQFSAAIGCWFWILRCWYAFCWRSVSRSVMMNHIQ
jgi:hypothetical protein